MSKNRWTDFWKAEETGFFKIMEMSTRICAERLLHKGLLHPGDKILDYGCGPGFLIDYLVEKEWQSSGLDINPFFVESCKKKHPSLDFYLLPTPTNEAESVSKLLDNRKFDVIVLLSIAQYLGSVAHLRSIIASITPSLAARGRIILADVVTPDTSSWRDAISLGVHSVRNGRVWNLLQFFYHLFTSQYRTVSKEMSLQTYTDFEINEIAKTCALRAEKIKGVTIHPTRSNYILTTV